MAKDEDHNGKSDPRVAGITAVGWGTFLFLGLCIPMMFAVSNPLVAAALPLSLIVGAGLLSARIWSSGERHVNQKANEKLTERIAELEERLLNLEMVDSVEAHMAERHRSPDKPTMGVPSVQETNS